MKRILTFVALMGVMIAAMAQRPMATLSHQGKLTFFNHGTSLNYSGSCFGEAVNAAVDGDTIYLSEGKFTASELENNEITKKITIVGCGRKTHILDDLYIKIKGVLTSALFNGVKLEGVILNDSVVNAELTKCYISELNIASSGVYDLKVDRCEVKEATYQSSYNSYEFYNSKIGLLDISNIHPMNGRIINCNVGKLYSNWDGFISSSIVNYIFNGGNRYYENCLVNQSLNSTSSNQKVENCYVKPESVENLLDENLELVEGLDLQASGFLGADGTVVGIYGGQWFPYSETPSMPTVDSSKSTVDFDQETNTLKVKITVTPN